MNLIKESFKRPENCFGFNNVIVQPGIYYLGDPCYVVEGKEWDDLLESCGTFQNQIGNIKGYQVAAQQTAHGDGEYGYSTVTDKNILIDPKTIRLNATNATKISVDSGLIALVPFELIDPVAIQAWVDADQGDIGCWVEIKEPTNFSYNTGTIELGPIYIDTDVNDTLFNDDNDQLEEDFFNNDPWN